MLKETNMVETSLHALIHGKLLQAFNNGLITSFSGGTQATVQQFASSI